MNPLEKFNLILQGNYVDPGFRQPSDSQMPMQNLFNTQQFSQDVANDKAQQDLIAKQQQDFRKANMLIALGDALKGKDIGQGLMQRQQLFQQQEKEKKAKMQEEKRQKLVEDFFKDPKYKNMVKIGGFDFAFKQQQAKMQEEKRQKLVEDFFKDPKYKNMVKIGGFDFAFKQQQADIERSEKEKANQAFIDSVKGTKYEGLIDVVGLETARDAYIANELKTQKLPADLQKLETLTQLRQRVIDDPSYTEDQYQQDATLLGVNQSFLKGKQEFITEYAKQLRGMKDGLGNPLYKDENEINQLANQAYDLYFPKEPVNLPESDEEVIDLGAFPPRDD